MYRIATLILLILMCANTISAFNLKSNKFYIGTLLGYGSTNWGRITTSPDSGLVSSLPIKSDDSGLAWGLFIGDDIGRYMGVELRYQKYADSKVHFGFPNIYRSDYQPFSMTSSTYNIALLGKLRIPLNERLQLYSILGATYTHRKDILNSLSGYGGVFGAGAQYHFTQHIANSLEFDFATGDATTDIQPAVDYLPFLTSFNYKISYYF